MNEKDIKKIAIEMRECKDISSVSNGIIRRFNKIKYGDDVMPMLRFMEWTFGVKNKGLDLDEKSVDHWKPIFKKCEEFIDKHRGDLQDYALIILRETLAHRYSDFYRFERKFEDRFNSHYQFSYETAKKNNYGLHIDGSMFWNGVAYNRTFQLDKAAGFFSIVVRNRLTYSDVRMPTLKVQSSFDFFEKMPKFAPKDIGACVIKLEEQNNKLAELLGPKAAIPLSKIKHYKERWC